MRRKDRLVTDIDEIKDILDKNDICRIGLKDEEGLYIVPLTYGYEFNDDKLTLYFHGANEGRKVEAFKKENEEVAFEIDGNTLLKGKDDIACSYTYFYRSIIGVGYPSIIEDYEEKLRAMDILLKNVTKKESFRYVKAAFDSVMVMKVEVTKYTAKKH